MFQVALISRRLRKNPCGLSFRGAAGDEESRKSFVSRARFLASLGMTRFAGVFQHPARVSRREILPCGKSHGSRSCRQRHPETVKITPHPNFPSPLPSPRGEGRGEGKLG